MQTQVIRFIWKNLRKNRFIRPFVLGYPPLGEDLSRLFLGRFQGIRFAARNPAGNTTFNEQFLAINGYLRSEILEHWRLSSSAAGSSLSVIHDDNHHRSNELLGISPKPTSCFLDIFETFDRIERVSSKRNSWLSSIPDERSRSSCITYASFRGREIASVVDADSQIPKRVEL